MQIEYFNVQLGDPFQLRLSYDPTNLKFRLLYNDEEVGSGKYFLPSMHNMDVEFDAFMADGDVTIFYMGFPLLGNILISL